MPGPRAVRTAKQLGDRLRALRRRRSLTQAALAERAGVSRQWLVEVEAGWANPTWEVILRLLNVLAADIVVADREEDGSPAPVKGRRQDPTDPDAVLAAHRASARVDAAARERNAPRAGD